MAMSNYTVKCAASMCGYTTRFDDEWLAKTSAEMHVTLSNNHIVTVKRVDADGSVTLYTIRNKNMVGE